MPAVWQVQSVVKPILFRFFYGMTVKLSHTLFWKGEFYPMRSPHEISCGPTTVRKIRKIGPVAFQAELYENQ